MQVSRCHFTEELKKVLCGKVRRRIGEILIDLCWEKGVQLEEGNYLSYFTTIL